MGDEDPLYQSIMAEELACSGFGGLIASLVSHRIGSPPIAAHGAEAQKERFLRPVLEGRKIAALAITEPGGGSDVANLRPTARRDGDHYV